MPNLSIKNVPDEVLDKLRERASRHHRSIQGELMALLSAALESQASGGEPPGAPEVPKMRRSGTRRIEEIAAEHRERVKKPLKRGPLAVDLIRAERDAR
jgi:predicted secreted Zn-dependent protease